MLLAEGMNARDNCAGTLFSTSLLRSNHLQWNSYSWCDTAWPSLGNSIPCVLNSEVQDGRRGGHKVIARTILKMFTELLMIKIVKQNWTKDKSCQIFKKPLNIITGEWWKMCKFLQVSTVPAFLLHICRQSAGEAPLNASLKTTE